MQSKLMALLVTGTIGLYAGSGGVLAALCKLQSCSLPGDSLMWTAVARQSPDFDPIHQGVATPFSCH